MATTPTQRIGAPSNKPPSSGSSSFTSWLKRSTSSYNSVADGKLASPAEEIKVVFLRQLKLSNLELNGRHHHSVFTGAQIVDIILDHFGLPDRQLACRVASRMIDCSLYKHVAGPSMNRNEQGQEGTATAKENNRVVDSNAEIYMLTPEAHVALKSMHQRGTADLLFRSKKKQPKKEREGSSESVEDNNTPSSVASSSSSSGGADDREPQFKPRIGTRLPPALDIRHLRNAGRQLLNVATAGARVYKSLSPADTLVPNKPDRVERSSTSSRDSDRSASSLQEVDIPTGNLDGLLNTWTVLADDNKPPLPIQTTGGDNVDDDEGEDSYRYGMSYTSRRQMQLRRICRRRWGAMCSDDFTELMMKGGNRRQLPRAIRRCPSAPSIYEQLSDRQSVGNAIESMASEPTDTTHPSSSFGFGSLESRQLAMHRPSLPLARDEWNGPRTAASLFNRSSISSNRDSSSRFSDLTITSSITGGSFLRGMNTADQAMSIFSNGTTPRSQHRTSLVQDTADLPITASAFPAPIRTTDLASNTIGPQGLVSAPLTSNGSTKQLQRSFSGVVKSSSAHSRNSESSEKRNSRPLTLWRNTVSSDLLATLTPETIAQQEAIFELINTEHDYLHDLDMINTVFVDPLTNSQPSILPDNRPVKEFLDILFYNYQQLIDINQRLVNRLQERQQESDKLVVSGIGDIMDEWADDLSALIDYSVHVPVAQCELESELLRSPELAQFLRDAEHAPGARKLPIQSFIGRPATRFARYPLLLSAIVKSQPTDSFDTQHLVAAIGKVRQALTEIDNRSGEQADRLRIRQISQRLELVGGARQSLALDSPTRRLIKEGRFVDNHGQSSVVLVFLFDNSLIMATEERVSYAKGIVRYVADERIIPISMLDVHIPIEQNYSSALGGIRGVLGLQQATGNKVSTTSSSSSLKQMNRQNSTPILQAEGIKQQQENLRLPLAFVHIGCRSLCRTLLASSEQERQQWVSAASQRVCVPQTLVEAHSELRLLSDRDFVLSRMPLCSSTFMSSTSSGCQMVLYGNRDGLHMGIHGVPTSVIRVSHTGCVHKIQVLRAYNMVAVLSDSSLLIYSLSAIERATVGEPGGVVGHKVASSVSFFDVGTYMNAPLLVLMKSKSGGRSHFKCLQPRFNSDDTLEEQTEVDDEEEEPAESLRLLYQGSRASLHLIGEFSIPGRTRQVYFLRRKLCVVGARGFEIVDVKSCQLLRSLPDPLDDDFSFVDHGGEALAICKVGREFLLCFEAFAFFIDNFGRRSRPQVFVRWEHRPQSVVFRHPYMVAINPVFLEVRHMETGVLLSVVRLKGGRCLNPQSRSSALHVVVGPDASRCRVVPGLAGPQGDREFPEGLADHYRIVEIKLPPLKVL